MSAIVLVFVAWLAITPRDQDGEPDETPTAGPMVPVEDFIAFAEATPGSGVPAIGLEHEYTAEGIVKLAAAIESLVPDPNDRTREQLSRLRNHAARLRDDPASLEHADVARAAFTSIAAMLNSAPGADAHELQRAADVIDSDQKLLTQMDRVTRYFDIAADVLRADRQRVGS
jgi:hypothetical protein